MGSLIEKALKGQKADEMKPVDSKLYAPVNFGSPPNFGPALSFGQNPEYASPEFDKIEGEAYTAPVAPHGSSRTAPTAAYSPPSTAEMYAKYRETGAVPYRHYAVAAPTRPGEADVVRQSMPGSFPSQNTGANSVGFAFEDWLNSLLKVISKAGN